jgi:hypothetical protein
MYELEPMIVRYLKRIKSLDLRQFDGVIVSSAIGTEFNVASVAWNSNL